MTSNATKRARWLALLPKIRAEVFTEDGLTLKLRPVVLCSRTVNGDGKQYHSLGARTA